MPADAAAEARYARLEAELELLAAEVDGDAVDIIVDEGLRHADDAVGPMAAYVQGAREIGSSEPAQQPVASGMAATASAPTSASRDIHDIHDTPVATAAAPGLGTHAAAGAGSGTEVPHPNADGAVRDAHAAATPPPARGDVRPGATTVTSPDIALKTSALQSKLQQLKSELFADSAAGVYDAGVGAGDAWLQQVVDERNELEIMRWERAAENARLREALARATTRTGHPGGDGTRQAAMGHGQPRGEADLAARRMNNNANADGINGGSGIAANGDAACPRPNNPDLQPPASPPPPPLKSIIEPLAAARRSLSPLHTKPFRVGGSGSDGRSDGTPAAHHDTPPRAGAAKGKPRHAHLQRGAFSVGGVHGQRGQVYDGGDGGGAGEEGVGVGVGAPGPQPPAQQRQQWEYPQTYNRRTVAAAYERGGHGASAAAAAAAAATNTWSTSPVSALSPSPHRAGAVLEAPAAPPPPLAATPASPTKRRRRYAEAARGRGAAPPQQHLQAQLARQTAQLEEVRQHLFLALTEVRVLQELRPAGGCAAAVDWDGSIAPQLASIERHMEVAERTAHVDVGAADLAGPPAPYDAGPDAAAAAASACLVASTRRAKEARLRAVTGHLSRLAKQRDTLRARQQQIAGKQRAALHALRARAHDEQVQSRLHLAAAKMQDCAASIKASDARLVQKEALLLAEQAALVAELDPGAAAAAVGA